MKKVLIVGAGVQGGPCASILARDENVSEIVIGDIDEELAQKARDKIGSDKIKAIKLDAGNADHVAEAAEGSQRWICPRADHPARWEPDDGAPGAGDGQRSTGA